MELVVSLLPLALLIGLCWWGVLLYRRSQKNVAPGAPLYGVGGWLKFFVIVMVVLSPLYAVGNITRTLSETVEAYPDLLQMDAWRQYKIFAYSLIGGLILWQWFIAYRLVYRFEPWSVYHARILLLVAPTLMVVLDHASASHFFDVPFEIDEASLRESARAIFGSLMWALYFFMSKRVKNTYFSGASVTPRSDLSPGQVG